MIASSRATRVKLMPLLNIDLPSLATSVLPKEDRQAFDALPVSERLARIATRARAVGNITAHASAMNALAVLADPAYLGLSAVRLAVQTCSTLVRIPADRCDFLMAAVATPKPQNDGFTQVAKWPREAAGRWALTVTTQDVARALVARSDRNK
ncbi:hypothetical protein [Arcanobacterium phocae]|uniref:hypothetical protein n=1 Tax=Arcanobacterium phocae TaxID=131112 RepID=UPI001C119019|nr:hypothetical protein [Arcanobacterium phocae]